MKQLWDICTIEFYPAVKKKKILLFATVWMDLENIMLSEISQSEKDKYHMISLICGRNLMKKTKLTRKMGTDSQMDNRMTAEGRIRVWRDSAKRKKRLWT